MKLLLDQNLSRKLVKQIQEAYPESYHLTAVLPEDSTDRDIWPKHHISVRRRRGEAILPIP